jgi:hypothetical protein
MRPLFFEVLPQEEKSRKPQIRLMQILTTTTTDRNSLLHHRRPVHMKAYAFVFAKTHGANRQRESSGEP